MLFSEFCFLTSNFLNSGSFKKDMKTEALKTYWSYFVKIGFLLFGLADLLGFLPNSLDFLDKVLTSIILIIFWLELKPSKFLFGKEKKWLDIAILTSFYILVIDTFVSVIRLIDLHDGFVQQTGTFLSEFNVLGFGTLVKHVFLYLHNPANASIISLYSIIIGFTLLIAISIYTATKMTYGKKSVLHSFVSLFIRKDSSWKNFADTEGYSKIPKFFISLLVLFSIYQYFFSLVNQWFIVSLDKALLVLAIFYAVKDIKGSKSEALNKIGSFDEWLLKSITDIFTNKKLFFMGFAILLLAHFLSDLSTFFLPFLFGFLTIDPYYLQYLGDPNGVLHQSVQSLLSSEAIHTVEGFVLANIGYFISILGLLILILLPLFLAYLFLAKKSLQELLQKTATKIFVRIGFFSVLLFIMAPWVRQRTITMAGVQGVDFVTSKIGLLFPPQLLLPLFLLLFGISFFISWKKSYSWKLDNYFFFGIFITSLTYLGRYVLHYFLSSTSYHFTTIQYLSQTHHYFVAIIFVLMYFLEFLFYIGSFILLVYYLSLYFIKGVFHIFLSKQFLVFWTFVLLFVPMFLLFPSSIEAVKVSSIFILVFFLFSFALYHSFSRRDNKYVYVLAITSIFTFFQSILIFQIVVEHLHLFSVEVFNFLQFIVVALFAGVLVHLLSQNLLVKKVSFKDFVITLFWSGLFGFLFFFIGESIPQLLSKKFIFLVIFTFFIALGEEILFRGLLYRLAQKLFSKKSALHLQAIVFSLVHFTGLAYLIHYFIQRNSFGGNSVVIGSVNMLVYFVLLYFFSIVAAKLMRKTDNVLLPILLHWLVDLLAISLAIFLG